jgi:Mrp family chromosome partitioning ATPase
LLKGDVRLDDVIISLSIPNLWVIPGRYENGSLLDQASSRQIEVMIDSVKDNNQNIIIVDLPPILAKDDTMAIASHLDGTILVVEEGSTQSDEVSRAAELLKQNNLIGCVLNKFSRYQVEFY